MDLFDVVVIGLVAIFIIGVVVISAFLMIGEYVHPIMKNISAEHPGSSQIDVGENLDFGKNMFYIAMFILFIAPFLLILVKYFYEKEARTI